jgi:hypothetical protein
MQMNEGHTASWLLPVWWDNGEPPHSPRMQSETEAMSQMRIITVAAGGRPRQETDEMRQPMKNQEGCKQRADKPPPIAAPTHARLEASSLQGKA